MTEQKLVGQKVVLGATKGKLVRFSHLHVHEAKLNSESMKMEKSVVALIPKGNVEDIKAVKDAIARFKKEVWTDQKRPVPPQWWNPLRDGDNDVKSNGKPYGDECKGHYVLNCKADEDSDIDIVGSVKDAKGKYVQLTKKEVKSGDWGRISVMLKPYLKGTHGVGCYLNNVQLKQEGEALAGGSSAEDDFSEFEDDDDLADDPLMQ